MSAGLTVRLTPRSAGIGLYGNPGVGGMRADYAAILSQRTGSTTQSEFSRLGCWRARRLSYPLGRTSVKHRFHATKGLDARGILPALLISNIRCPSPVLTTTCRSFLTIPLFAVGQAPQNCLPFVAFVIRKAVPLPIRWFESTSR